MPTVWEKNRARGVRNTTEAMMPLKEGITVCPQPAYMPWMDQVKGMMMYSQLYPRKNGTPISISSLP